MSRKLGLTLAGVMSLSMTGCAQEKLLVVGEEMARQIVPDAEAFWDVANASLENGFKPAKKIVGNDPEALRAHARSQKQTNGRSAGVQQRDLTKAYDMNADIEEAFKRCHQAIWSGNAS